MPYIEKRFGKYPYPQYSFIQGGDGGMEYAMATLLKGPGLGTVFHEWMHSWYQQILGTNESLFAWMDEGFTSYAENEVMHFYNNNFAMQSPWTSTATKAALKRNMEVDKDDLPFQQADNYAGYFALAKSPFEEPMTQHADHFNTNFGYSLAAYSKGSVFINQLGYIVGDAMRDKILLSYYNQWKFKHPNANDFVRVAEKESGLALQWYKE
nr:M1 family peptidase [Chitinophagaceae bacterium]